MTRHRVAQSSGGIHPSLVLKSLRVPERLFQLATWVVSIVFAGFLIGLGGKIVGDLPGVDQDLSIEQFLDPAQLARDSVVRDSLTRLQSELIPEQERARLRLTTVSTAYRQTRTGFENWIATRRATTDPQQDPEVLRRTRELDELQQSLRGAQTNVDGIDGRMLEVTQAMETQQRAEAERERAAEGRYQRARFWKELRIFGIRLALTLPLLLFAGWLVARKRSSQYWPLARGFVLFAIFAFFVELVPYLPSYGGYVRYGIGVIATAIVGVYVIRAMQRYLAKRAEVARQTESERRRALDYEEALRRMGAGVCPGCERPIAKGEGGLPVNFCVHCGMNLFDSCPACSARKNAFYHYCPACGVDTGDTPGTPSVSGAAT